MVPTYAPIPLAAVATVLGKPLRTVQRMVAEGDIPATKIGGGWAVSGQWLWQLRCAHCAEEARADDGAVGAKVPSPLCVVSRRL